MAKQAKYEGLLDSLPDSILCRILSFLPTKDAVRTSILSPRWRYLFTLSISELDFSDCLPDSRVSEEHTVFKKFVDRLFFNPKYLRLECFRVNDLWVSDGSLDDGFLSIYNWLCAALWRGVKEIDVNLFRGDIRKLPTLLFTCPSLVTLKLDILGDELKLPTIVCLPNLRTLHLSGMELFDGCSFLRLISGCPVLEDLGLFACFLNGSSELNIRSLSLKRLVLDFESWVDVTAYRASNDFDWLIVIDAPSLVYFKYFCFVWRGYDLRNMESLERADITIFHLKDVDRDRSATLLRGICNVQVLHLSIHDYDAPLCRMPLDSGLAFCNLVELEFKNHCDDCKLSLTWIVKFLRLVPNLKKLIMDMVVADRVFESLPEEVPSCLLHHLKEISIFGFTGDTSTFEMVSYFLNHASVLEKLMMTSIDVPQECRSSIIEKL
ncbi:hypothetical protein V6N13_038610 [Hibiscus sabdariffa]|uniref:Uncharacterized protein n=2 Tax=Hibiscus sabdariffa TaxID=183260 RepID=A0ABR2B788_9ROSI